MIQINPLKSYIDGGVRAALTTPPSASLVFDLPGKAIWVKGVKLKGTDHTYIFNHDNYITLTNTPDKNNPESEDIKIGVNITTLKNVIDTTYNGGTLALLQEGLNTEERTWLAKILHNYINNILPTTKNLQINGTNYAIYTTENSLPLFFVPTSLGTTGQILACTSSGLSWINLIQNTDYRVSLSSATSNSDYRIILKQGANNNPETDFVRFSEYLTFNPYTKTLKINNIKVVTATDIYTGSTAGLVPAATSAQLNYYLRGDGAWVNIATEMAAANTWRPIKVGNTDALGSGTNTGTLSFIAGTGITLAWDATNKRIIITNSSPDVNHNTDENVRQVPKTDNVNRPLMMINGSTSAGEQINTSMFSTGIYANASTKMITANGFIKAGSSDNYVLLGGGSHKALSDFSMNHEHPYLPIAYISENQTDDWGKNYAKIHYNSYVYNSSGREWSYWIGMRPDLAYGNILRLSHDGLVLYCHKTGGDKDSNWSSWKSIITSDNYNSYSPKLDGTGASGTWNINISGNATTANTAIVWKRTWERSNNCLINIPSSETRVYMADSLTENKPCSGAGFIIGHGWDWGYGGAMIYQDFDGNDGGRLYTNSRQCDGAWQGWNKIAFVKEIPTVTDYYWANIKVSASSSTSTLPTFNTCYTSNWFRSTGLTGWYNESYGGGINMVDSTWVRIYNNKKFYVNNSDHDAIHSAGGVYVAGMVHAYANYLRSTCNGAYVLIGPQNGSHVHYETDATVSHWFNKRVDVNGAIWRYGTNYGIDSDGKFYAHTIYANRSGSGTAGGVSLYSNSDPMVYGIASRDTASYGTHGYVTGDWATYLTMSNTPTRGWIFRTHDGTRRLSINAQGHLYANGLVDADRFNSRVATGTQPYACTSTTLNTNLNADLLDGLHGSRYTCALGSPNYITINVGGDANTYYPVVISSVSAYYPMLFVNISRTYSETAPNTWNTSTHKGGLTLTLLWNGSRYWDGNSAGAACYCVYKNESYSTMVGGLGNATGGKVVWLRGGGAVYHIHSMNGTSTSVTVYTSTYTDSAKQSFAPKTTPEVISVRWPGYTQGADYASSAGNADTVDGNHASAFAAASHTHPYLPLSGGTMTGQINWTPRNLSAGDYSLGLLRFDRGYQDYSGSRRYFPWIGGSDYVSGAGYGNTISIGAYHATYDDCGLYIGMSWDGNNSSVYMTFSRYGDITASNFYSSSDIRLKDNINNISKSIRSFNWKESGLKSYGLIAQEIENEYPELISSNDNGYKSINYTSALCMLIAKLENGLDELKEKVKLLEDKLRKYENTL